MTKDDLKNLLRGQSDREFVQSQILSRRPWIFTTDVDYDKWLNSVADRLALSHESIRIVGSAATGFSLSPMKAGRAFRGLSDLSGRSDIDIAVMDSVLFETAWNAVVASDRQLLLGGNDDIRMKIRLDIYWGVISQKSVPLNTPTARRLLTAMSVAGGRPPLRGHAVRCRLYRRPADLQAYHVASLRRLRAVLAMH